MVATAPELVVSWLHQVAYRIAIKALAESARRRDHLQGHVVPGQHSGAGRQRGRRFEKRPAIHVLLPDLKAHDYLGQLVGGVVAVGGDPPRSPADLAFAQCARRYWDEFETHHYMIYFDSAGCFEVIAESWEVYPEEEGSWETT